VPERRELWHDLQRLRRNGELRPVLLKRLLRQQQPLCCWHDSDGLWLVGGMRELQRQP